ncbi:MAG: dienelactone hydrolase family protein [Puniceicoccaceae bacterium]
MKRKSFRQRALVGVVSAAFFLPTLSADDSGDLGTMAIRSITYELDGATLESTIVWDADEDDARPGVLMVPNWMGPTRASLEKAMKVAGDDYVVMMVDLYGTDVRPANQEEAGEAAGVLRGDRDLMRARMAKALGELRGQKELPLDTGRIGAIGFCFGGGAVLEFARTGADLRAVVSFHGDLLSPTLEDDSKEIRGSVLVLHGADDPYVPQNDVREWIGVMRDTDVDWQLVQFSNTVHSFTDPRAATPGRAEFDPVSSRRAFEYMEELFENELE